MRSFRGALGFHAWYEIGRFRSPGRPPRVIGPMIYGHGCRRECGTITTGGEPSPAPWTHFVHSVRALVAALRDRRIKMTWRSF